MKLALTRPSVLSYAQAELFQLIQSAVTGTEPTSQHTCPIARFSLAQCTSVSRAILVVISHILGGR